MFQGQLSFPRFPGVGLEMLREGEPGVNCTDGRPARVLIAPPESTFRAAKRDWAGGREQASPQEQLLGRRIRTHMHVAGKAGVVLSEVRGPGRRESA